MKTFQLKGLPREIVGKKASKAVRKGNMIPAVLYGGEPVAMPYEGALNTGENVVDLGRGKGVVVTSFTVTQDDIRGLVYTSEVFLVELSLEGGKNTMAIIKDIQFHPVTDAILHIDFLEIFENKPIVIDVPVALEGYAEGVKAGGKLSLEMRKLKVKALYREIPEKLTINITTLGLGKTIQVGSLHFDHLELVNAKNAVVCAVKLTRAARGAAASK
ncbi:MAG: 50S ribosomal protein L25/general stress protein Ctc [Tannerellaceae bacterium]|jgi:large subunit ribosomal protein L25|nr:50S ribosomal protein L25/general stress protein Ctc [Tannerellaceae bacterium]